jgi:hypothetical protein
MNVDPATLSQFIECVKELAYWIVTIRNAYLAGRAFGTAVRCRNENTPHKGAG